MQTVLRVTLIFLFLMIGLRLLGKREFGQLAPFDLVILLMIPEIVSQALVREDFSLTNAIIGATTLLSLVFLTSVASYLSKGFEKVVEGTPSVLVHNGFLVPDSMNKERVAPDEITAEMHKAGLEMLSQVKWAVLETDGKITFVPWNPGGGTPHQDEKHAI